MATRGGKTDRNNPKNARSSNATTTVFDFERRFPDDAACLKELVRMLYPDGINCPNCGKVTKHHRLKKRPAYACQFCGHLEYPMKGTIFEGSSTSLKLWFYGMYLMASTRGGISAKQLERETGVSYPTALRMFRQIRSLLDQDDVLLGGTVEMDESYFGGKDKWKHERKRAHVGTGGITKTPVVGIVQRGARGTKGKVVVKVADGMKKKHLLPHAQERILPSSTVFTDESYAYRDLDGLGYQHHRVNHAQGVYVSGDVHTNTIEGFWATVKRGIGGTYHSVSTTYLQTYLDEYAFRYNHRDEPAGMFEAFLGGSRRSPISHSAGDGLVGHLIDSLQSPPSDTG